MSFEFAIPKEMRQKYIDRRDQDLAALKNALAVGEFDLFFKVGHQLKGNAATFGYDSLGSLGEAMEGVAASGNAAAAQDCVAKLQRWLEDQRSIPT